MVCGYLMRGTLQVRRSVSKGKTNLPKTSKSRRSIKLSRTATEALKRHKKRQSMLSEWVFCTHKGTPISSQNLLWKAWENVRKKAEPTGLTPFSVPGAMRV